MDERGTYFVPGRGGIVKDITERLKERAEKRCRDDLYQAFWEFRCLIANRFVYRDISILEIELDSIRNRIEPYAIEHAKDKELTDFIAKVDSVRVAESEGE
jgi:hypothetical protein